MSSGSAPAPVALGSATSGVCIEVVTARLLEIQGDETEEAERERRFLLKIKARLEDSDGISS